QRRRDEAGALEGVEADDRELARHLDAGLARALERTDRHVVVEREERRGRLRQPEESERRRFAARDVEVAALHERRLREDACTRERCAVAREPVLHRDEATRTGDRADTAVAEREQ